MPGLPEGPVDAKKFIVEIPQAAGDVRYNLVASLFVPILKAKCFKFWHRLVPEFILIPLSLGSNGLPLIGCTLGFASAAANYY